MVFNSPILKNRLSKDINNFWHPLLLQLQSTLIPLKELLHNTSTIPTNNSCFIDLFQFNLLIQSEKLEKLISEYYSDIALPYYKYSNHQPA